MIREIPPFTRMQFQIIKNEAQLGPFTEAELRQQIADGELSGSDLGWREGLEEWQPLNVLLGLTAPRPLPRSTVSLQEEGTSGLAIGSLLCGIFGMFGFTALVAVILGHISLAQIRRSDGALRGRGMAIGGLVLGYLQVVVFGFGVLAALAWPAYNAIKEKAELTKASKDAIQIVFAAKSYAVDHEGNYPGEFMDLVRAGLLTEAQVLECSLSKNYPGVAWEYHGAGVKDSAPPKTLIFTSTTTPKLKKRVAAFNDGSVEIIRDKNASEPSGEAN